MEGSGSVLKVGEVSLQQNKLFGKSWAKKFCVLYKKSEDQHPYLEFYDSRECFDKSKSGGKADVKKVELQQVKYVKTSSERAGKDQIEHHIEVKCRAQKLMLMLDKESDALSWSKNLSSVSEISGPCEEEPSTISADFNGQSDSDDDGDDNEVITLNQMYASSDQAERFSVKVEKSDLSTMCDIVGNMTLLIGPRDIAFERPETKQIKYTFQFAWMRRFGKKGSAQFYFEVGRKCPNGEGTVTCDTPSARELHKRVSLLSKSNSKTVIPHSLGSSATVEKTKSESTHAQNDAAAHSGKPLQVGAPVVTNPSLAQNMTRRHPGARNTPALVPLKIPQPAADERSITPTSPKRGSSKMKDNDSSDRGSVGSVGKKVASKIQKELEEKLHVAEDGKAGSVKHKEDSVKRPKEDKKALEKEEKHKEDSVKTAKEVKKAREKEEKREKDEKKKKEKEEKKREKEMKKSKKKDENENHTKNEHSSSFRQRNNVYDEPELVFEERFDSGESFYDEATSPVTKNAANVSEYAEPYQVKKGQPNKPNSMVYDEACSVSRESRKSAPIEYAQPFNKKGGVPVVHVDNELMAYADVKTIENNAWKSLGRGDADTVFEEDYSSIKSARSELKKTPPPVPNRGYNPSEAADDDDTYNRLDHLPNRQKHRSQPTENLYGTAGGRKVGPIVSTVPIGAGDNSDSGEEYEEEEDPYDEAGYEASPDLPANAVAKHAAALEGYEEAEPPKPAALKPKPATLKPKPVHVEHREPLYEEVG